MRVIRQPDITPLNRQTPKKCCHEFKSWVTFKNSNIAQSANLTDFEGGVDSTGLGASAQSNDLQRKRQQYMI